MQKITPFLWFDNQSEEAMNFYVSILKKSKVLSVSPGPNGKALPVTFQGVSLGAFETCKLTPAFGRNDCRNWRTYEKNWFER